jgi:four helix bundle protein
LENVQLLITRECFVHIHAGFLSARRLLVAGGMTTPINGIDDRAFEFFCGMIRFVRTIRPEPGVRRLLDQMVAASGSIAANREEATSASSRREFVRFNEIALRSAKESVLWLRACDATGLGTPQSCVALLTEARQLARILGAIVVNSKRGGREH